MRLAYCSKTTGLLGVCTRSWSLRSGFLLLIRCQHYPGYRSYWPSRAPPDFVYLVLAARCTTRYPGIFILLPGWWRFNAWKPKEDHARFVPSQANPNFFLVRRVEATLPREFHLRSALTVPLCCIQLLLTRYDPRSHKRIYRR